MGLFDSVYAACPTCGSNIEFQSKEGDCACDTYTTDNAPTGILLDIINSPEYCSKCGCWSALYDPAFPPNKEEQPRPHPKMRRVRTPENPQIHESQSFLRWWNEPFSEADFLPPSTDPGRSK